MNGHVFERILWSIVWTLFIRPFPRKSVCKWEILLLRLFGATIGKGCTIYSSTKIWLPRNLRMDDYATLADHVELLNSEVVHLKEGSRVSQYTYICNGSHDISDYKLPRISKPIIIGERAWVTSKCYIGLGITIGRGSVISAGSVLTVNLPPYTVASGNPSKVIGFRFTPEEIIEHEKALYPEEKRLPLELLEKNYKKYYLDHIKEIKAYTGLICK